MILNKRVLLLCFISTTILSCSTQNDINSPSSDNEPTTMDSVEATEAGQEFEVMQEQVFDSLIHTVLLHNSSFELSLPIIKLNSKEKLKLRFDDFGEENRNITYNIIKCNKDWQRSSDNRMSYIEGYFYGQITNFEYSHNTLTGYTHYTVDFPKYENYKIIKSGNYILQVIDESENILLTKRFQVLEQLCDINPTVRKASDIMDANYRQEIDFEITTQQAIQNPIRNITVHLYKNRNKEGISKNLVPKFVDGNTLKYDYDNENTFDGGNEFRTLNLKSIRNLLQYVYRVDKVDNNYLVSLREDVAKTYKTYSFKDDLNGNFLIKNEDRPKASHLNSEYLSVMFRLNYKKALAEGDFYVFGGISNWGIKDDFKLKYNPDENIFECTALIKQGYYDYEYVYVKDGVMDEGKIEGTHFATQNEYTIQVYWTDNFGEERLIGHQTFLAHP